MPENHGAQPKDSKLKIWLKSVGIAGLIFFTLKGIAWLFVFYDGAEFLKQCTGK